MTVLALGIWLAGSVAMAAFIDWLSWVREFTDCNNPARVVFAVIGGPVSWLVFFALWAHWGFVEKRRRDAVTLR